MAGILLMIITCTIVNIYELCQTRAWNLKATTKPARSRKRFFFRTFVMNLSFFNTLIYLDIYRFLCILEKLKRFVWRPFKLEGITKQKSLIFLPFSQRKHFPYSDIYLVQCFNLCFTYFEPVVDGPMDFYLFSFVVHFSNCCVSLSLNH